MVRYDDVGRWREFEQQNTCVNVLERSRGMGGAGGFKGQPWRSLVSPTPSRRTLTSSPPHPDIPSLCAGPLLGRSLLVGTAFADGFLW